MKLKDKVVVVTGGAQGIGKALCERFHAEGAKAIAVADIKYEPAQEVARTVGGQAYRCDVADTSEIMRVIDDIEARFGPIALFCSNAGVADFSASPNNAASAPDSAWNRSWAINVMAHVYAARILVPRMIERGGGYFLNTVSAAGLLSQVGNAIYSTTKHAAVGFAENLAISHYDQGIRVSILCPQGVDTQMLNSAPLGPQSLDGVLSPADVADSAVQGLEREAFLILPHAQVADYMKVKAEDYQRWLRGMVKLNRQMPARPYIENPATM